MRALLFPHEQEITAKDYDTLVPYLEMAIDREGPLCLFCDMSEFSGMEIAAMWRDLKFGIGHSRDFHRLAVVGGRKWMEWCVKLTAPYSRPRSYASGPARRRKPGLGFQTKKRTSFYNQNGTSPLIDVLSNVRSYLSLSNSVARCKVQRLS